MKGEPFHLKSDFGKVENARKGRQQEGKFNQMNDQKGGNMEIGNQTWEFVQKHLGYTDEEMRAFKENPRNGDILAKAPALMNKTIVIKIVESHGCNSGHRVGDKIYFDGAGNLITKNSPKRICVYALSSAAKLIFASNELFYADVDPNEMRFKRSGCTDVGLQCGGWGRVVIEIGVEDRQKT
jgi:uncharacterized repeat protein (TIGR04076 family)